MLYTIKHKIKASVLLSVFSLNTVVGFACSVGLDMGFNSNHHEESTEGVVHVHSDGKKHIHYEKKQDHKHEKSGHHKSKSGRDNCCNDQVLKVQQIDKSVPGFWNVAHLSFTSIFVSSINYDVFCPPGIAKDIKQFVRSYHPPISNIYIEVQSFRI